MFLEQPRSAKVGRQTVKLWDIASGKELDEKRGHWFDDQVMAYSPDGKTLAVAAYDRTIQVWDAATGRVLGQIGGLSERATALAIGPDGRLYSGTPGTGPSWPGTPGPRNHPPTRSDRGGTLKAAIDEPSREGSLVDAGPHG